MQLSQRQADSIDQATARSNIWHGSVRSGKTVGSIMKWVEYAPTAPEHIDGHLMMVGKTERTLATNILTPPKKGTDEYKKWSMIHRMSPGPVRSKLRSKTFPGIAEAMAEQWGGEI